TDRKQDLRSAQDLPEVLELTLVLFTAPGSVSALKTDRYENGVMCGSRPVIQAHGAVDGE
ncbi:MAG: hypothetical protein DWI00_00180, partial [Planctomycetota bacterium]